MSDRPPGDDAYDAGSRVEATEAGVHHERAEAAAGLDPREHVTASPVIHHHHPADPNAGVARARLGPHTVLAGVLAAVVTVAAVVALAVAIGGGG